MSHTLIRSLLVGAAMLALLVASVPAQADVTLDYVGALRVNSGYYRSGLAFVPAGTNGDRTSGDVNVPTLITAAYGHSAADYLREWYIPADGSLAKTSGDTAPAATQVPGASGGTDITNSYWSQTVAIGTGLTLLNGRLLGLNGNQSASILKGELELGTVSTNVPAEFVVQGLNRAAGTHVSALSGLATKYDAANTLAYVTYDSSGGTKVYVNTGVRGADQGGGVYAYSTANEFWFTGPATANLSWAFTYAVIGGDGYYILYDSNAATGGHGNGATLDFYKAADFTGGVEAAAPSFSLNIDDLIGNAFGWNTSTAVIMDMGFDPGTGRLYVIEDNPSAGRSGALNATVHVLQLAAPVPEPATLGLLALGGLGMIGAAVRRRRTA